MSSCQPLEADRQLLTEIDGLQRALRNLHHWAATAQARRSFADDRGRRLFAAAAGLRDQAWADSLEAAYALFGIDAIHMLWCEQR